MKKPEPIIRKVLKLDDCIEYAIQQNILSQKQADTLIDYYRELGGSKWELYLTDIEEENGIEHEDAGAFLKFYNEFKDCEYIKEGEKQFVRIMFDTSTYD